jgi:hypothetical protein
LALYGGIYAFLTNASIKISNKYMEKTLTV